MKLCIQSFRNGRKNKDGNNPASPSAASTASADSPGVPQQNDLDTIELPPESVQFTDIAQEMYLDGRSAPSKAEQSPTYVTINTSDIETLAIETIQLSPSALDLNSLDLNFYLDENGESVTQNQQQKEQAKPPETAPTSSKSPKSFSDPVQDIYQAMEKTVIKHPWLDTYQREFEEFSHSPKEVSKEFFSNLHTLVLQRMMTFIHNIKSFNL